MQQVVFLQADTFQLFSVLSLLAEGLQEIAGEGILPSPCPLLKSSLG